ncbi:MAG: bifunctional adenosylcobinamide kinase/adenosylcobinamide-phosphate guanylyltransferase [Eubacteriales bacterium]|nr:bifunctional adenosylcobinamide kinase/adenosylcobinamide-phosphate guanylyltransferase [Eubacteriales bacterium]
MILVIGGAFQGKTEYAQKTYQKREWMDCEQVDWYDCDSVQKIIEIICGFSGILHFEKVIRYMVEAKIDYSAFAEMIIEKCSDTIFTIQEVGYGVVPIDAKDREYREAVGRIATKLAAYSNQVVRVVCGIGTVIKNEK